MTASPRNLQQALKSFTDVYSPRIVARVNDYDVRIAHADGEHVWHSHADTDEFFLVLDGHFTVALRDGDGDGDGDGERTVTLGAGDVFVVPRGVAHRPSGARASILMFEPHGTSSTGDADPADIPGHVDSTTGRDLGEVPSSS